MRPMATRIRPNRDRVLTIPLWMVPVPPKMQMRVSPSLPNINQVKEASSGKAKEE